MTRRLSPRIVPAIQIARCSRLIALESVIAGIGLSLLGMIAAALDYIMSVQGALIQEAIDVAVILNALQALGESETYDTVAKQGASRKLDQRPLLAQSGHSSNCRCPVSANCRLMQRSKPHLYSIISSAWTSSAGGISKSIAFAVLRLNDEERAGADGLQTYFAPQAAEKLKAES